MTSTEYETEGMTWNERSQWALDHGEHIVGDYTLTAERDGQTATKVLTFCEDDTDAMFRGTNYVLNTGRTEVEGGRPCFWSKGRIELRDPDGELIQTIEEKKS